MVRSYLPTLNVVPQHHGVGALSKRINLVYAGSGQTKSGCRPSWTGRPSSGVGTPADGSKKAWYVADKLSESYPIRFGTIALIRRCLSLSIIGVPQVEHVHNSSGP